MMEAGRSKQLGLRFKNAPLASFDAAWCHPSLDSHKEMLLRKKERKKERIEYEMFRDSTKSDIPLQYSAP